jgi:hypothetical protein
MEAGGWCNRNFGIINVKETGVLGHRGVRYAFCLKALLDPFAFTCSCLYLACFLVIAFGLAFVILYWGFGYYWGAGAFSFGVFVHTVVALAV